MSRQENTNPERTETEELTDQEQEAVERERLEAAAKNVFDRMVRNFESNGIKNYESDYLEEIRVHIMHFVYQGNDFPMEFHILVDVDRETICVRSGLPSRFSSEQLMEAALVANAINARISDGCFYIDMNDGQVEWRITSGFQDTEVSEEVFDYLLLMSLHIVDDFNDQFVLLEKDLVDTETLIGKILEEE